MCVILADSAVWAATKDAELKEKAQIASMMARKSRVDIMICCGGGVKVLGPVTSAGAVVLRAWGFRGVENAGAVVLGAGGFGGTEDAGVVGNGVRTEDAGIGGSSVCTAGGGCYFPRKSAAGWSFAGSEGGR